MLTATMSVPKLKATEGYFPHLETAIQNSYVVAVVRGHITAAKVSGISTLVPKRDHSTSLEFGRGISEQIPYLELRITSFNENRDWRKNHTSNTFNRANI